MFCVSVVFLFLFGLSYSQDDVSNTMNESDKLLMDTFSEPCFRITELTTQTVATLICEFCYCADNMVDCAKRDIARPFDLTEWEAMNESDKLLMDTFSEPCFRITELTTQTVATLICEFCYCADNIVDCAERDIARPFDLTEWEGLKDIRPTTVDLSANPLTSLTRLSELPIQNLNLSNCGIETIENNCFMNLVDLVCLDLSRNKLSTSSISRRVFEVKLIPGEDPRPFANLRYLSLAHNDIHSLPQDIFTFMTEILTLDLSGNPLAYIDQVTMAAISELTKLQELKLSRCELESLPEGLLRRQRRLIRLDLSGNSFTTVPAVLSEAVNLVFLSLDQNPITAINEKTSISSLSKLRELHLSRLSKLQSIASGALGGLDSLVSLHLCYNPRLTTLDPGFLMWEDDDVERYPLLKELRLNNNNLSEINSHLLERWDQLTRVDFTNNPYKCDCSNQWMVDVLMPLIRSTGDNESASHMICKKPQDLRGLTFAQMHDMSKKLQCPPAENMSIPPAPDMAILLGIMIGIFVTFPILLVVILLWRRGFFTRCRGKSDRRKTYYDEDENDAF